MLWAEIKALLRVAWPMMLAQGGLVLMGVVDTVYAGRVSSAEMAAVALGNNVTSVVMAIGIGLAMGIEPLVSQAIGRRDEVRALTWLRQGVWTSGAVAVPLSLASLVFFWVFDWMDIEAHTAGKASAYIWARFPGHLFCFWFSSYRAYASGAGRTRPVMLAVAVANVTNVALDHYLVLELGLGATGIGMATSTCWVVMLVVLGAFVRLDAARHGPIPFGPSAERMARVVRLGGPIGSQFGLEVAIFAVVSLLVATEGDVALAGHQIALTMAALIFMIATGIAIAATARVGQHVGAGDPEGAARAGWLAMVLGAAIMVVGGSVFFLAGEPIARFFAPEAPDVVDVGVRLLRLAALFAVFDGLQAVAAGALRGVGDTTFAFYANMVGYYAVGLPVSLIAGFGLGLGAAGFWWGLVAGLASVAVMLMLRFAVLCRGPMVPLESA